MLFTAPISSFLIDFFAPRLLTIEGEPKKPDEIVVIIEDSPPVKADTLRDAKLEGL